MDENTALVIGDDNQALADQKTNIQNIGKKHNETELPKIQLLYNINFIFLTI